MSASPGAVTAVVPAAGAARRFGGAKLLADIQGRPLLEHTLRSLLDGGVGRVVVVVAPRHGLDVVPLLVDPRVETVVNPDPDRGMFSSIQVGLRMAADGPVAVLPADMPFVSAETVARVVAEQARSGGCVVAALAGRRGHPVVLDGRVRPSLCDRPPETTLKAALCDVGVTLRAVDVDDAGVLRDVDVPGDLA